jgi:P-type conjugative transfer protein TrbJ
MLTKTKRIMMIMVLIPIPLLQVYAGGDDITMISNGLGAGVATEMTQLLNNALLKENSNYQERLMVNSGQELINQSEMLARQLTALNNMAKNTETISNPAWGQTNNLLRALAQVVGEGQALSYANQNADLNFKQLYPGYKHTKDYSQEYRKWSQSSMDSMRGSLNAANLQSNDFMTEEQLINQLQQMSQSTEGRLQALQVGNMIAIENVQQMRKLRQLEMAQIQAQTTYLATMQQQELAKKAAQDNFFDVPEPKRAMTNQKFIGGSKR